MSKDPRRWDDAEQALLDALTAMIGTRSGSKGRSREAYRQAPPAPVSLVGVGR